MAVTRPKRWAFRDYVIWTVSALFILLGATKVTQLPFEVNALGYYGFPVWFVFGLGIWEILAGFGLLFRTTRFFAAGGLLIEMVAAGVTFLAAQTASLVVLPLATAAVLVMLFIRGYREQRRLAREGAHV